MVVFGSAYSPDQKGRLFGRRGARFDNPKSEFQNLTLNAEVAKLADALDLGSSVERRASSSLALGTNI